jgi:hypothetical protein
MGRKAQQNYIVLSVEYYCFQAAMENVFAQNNYPWVSFHCPDVISEMTQPLNGKIFIPISCVRHPW